MYLAGYHLENFEREDAYGEAEIRLLTTIAGSLGTALENARLFDETQSLLQETTQRNNELAIINSIQQGLASRLDFQGIVDLVGDSLRQVFNSRISVCAGMTRRPTCYIIFMSTSMANG